MWHSHVVWEKLVTHHFFQERSLIGSLLCGHLVFLSFGCAGALIVTTATIGILLSTIFSLVCFFDSCDLTVMNLHSINNIVDYYKEKTCLVYLCGVAIFYPLAKTNV